MDNNFNGNANANAEAHGLQIVLNVPWKKIKLKFAGLTQSLSPKLNHVYCGIQNLDPIY